MNRPSLRKKLSPPIVNGLQGPNGRAIYWWAILFYAILIVYASLYPLTGWTIPHQPLFSFLTEPVPDHISRADVLTNVLAYIPLGALLVWAFRTSKRLSAVAIATMVGGLLSFSMESVQMFLPSRTASNIDLLTNVIGTSFGASIGLVCQPRSALMLRAKSVRDEWFAPGRAVDAGLCSVLLWTLSQLSPFVPSMDISSIREGLRPAWYTLNDPAAFSFFKMFEYTLTIAGLALLIGTVVRRGQRGMFGFLCFAGAVLVTKPFIVSRQLSLEAICGLAVAAILVVLAPRNPARRALLSMVCIFASFMVAELAFGIGNVHSFNWIPFAGQMDNTVSGFGSILEGTWTFMALASLTIMGFGSKLRPMLYGGVTMLATVFAMEWYQQQIPGRYGDVTTVILAALGWSFPYLYVWVDRTRSGEVREASPRQRAHRSTVPANVRFP